MYETSESSKTNVYCFGRIYDLFGSVKDMRQNLKEDAIKNAVESGFEKTKLNCKKGVFGTFYSRNPAKVLQEQASDCTDDYFFSPHGHEWQLHTPPKLQYWKKGLHGS